MRGSSGGEGKPPKGPRPSVRHQEAAPTPPRARVWAERQAAHADARSGEGPVVPQVWVGSSESERVCTGATKL